MNKIKAIVILAVVAMASAIGASAITRLDVGTYNLRNNNQGDAKAGNGWDARKGVVAQLLRYHEFDIFGTQEGFIDQLQDLKELLPGYDYVGVGRDDGKQGGEHSAVFYNTEKYEALNSGNFWLSETPEKPGLGWDAVCVRICSWAHFRCRETGFEFLFFNLHMDHVGKVARVESAKLVQKKMKEFGSELPAILTGDFNIDQNHPSFVEIIESGMLKDSYEASEFKYALNGTFNAFRPNNFTESRIDHVLVSPSFEVKKYGILTDTYRSEVKDAEAVTEGAAPQEIKFKRFEARTPSDHFPVKVVLYHK